MSKVYESDIDADEFIRSFREEPSQPVAPAKKAETKKEQPARKDGAASKATVTSDEEEYLNIFVRNMDHMRPLDKYLMVDIHPTFVRKIKRVLSYETGQVCSLKAYINNVLSEHFKKYESFIEKRQ